MVIVTGFNTTILPALQKKALLLGNPAISQQYSQSGVGKTDKNSEEQQRMEDRLYTLEIRSVWYLAANHHNMLAQLLKLVVDVAHGRLILRASSAAKR